MLLLLWHETFSLWFEIGEYLHRISSLVLLYLRWLRRHSLKGTFDSHQMETGCPSYGNEMLVVSSCLMMAFLVTLFQLTVLILLLSQCTIWKALDPSIRNNTNKPRYISFAFLLAMSSCLIIHWIDGRILAVLIDMRIEPNLTFCVIKWAAVINKEETS